MCDDRLSGTLRMFRLSLAIAIVYAYTLYAHSISFSCTLFLLCEHRVENQFSPFFSHHVCGGCTKQSAISASKEVVLPLPGRKYLFS